MLPFLAADLHVVLCNLLSRFVKESILMPLKATRIVGVDVTEKSWLPIDYVDCGFAAKRLLKHLLKSKKISPPEVESSRTSLASRTSSRTHFEVLGLGLGLEGQVLGLGLGLEASSPRKSACPRLEDSTIF